MAEFGGLLMVLFGWVGMFWALLLLLAGVVWLFISIKRYFDQLHEHELNTVRWEGVSLGVQKICGASNEPDFDLAVAIVLNGSRQWGKAVTEGRVLEWESWEESQPTETGDFLLMVQCRSRYEISFFNGTVFKDEDGQDINGVLLWSKLLSSPDESHDGGAS